MPFISNRFSLEGQQKYFQNKIEGEDGEESKKTHRGLANRGCPFIEVENVKKEGIDGHLDVI